MILSGIGDEAGRDIRDQIKAHQLLGWSHIDLRMVGNYQCTDLDESAFEEVCGLLEEANLKVACFASGIANWSCTINDPFNLSIDTLQTAIPRMHRLNTRFIRVMSYPNAGLPDADWRDEVLRRMTVLGEIALDAGIVLVVENCDGWASTSPDNYAHFFESINLDSVKAVYDTGNPGSHGMTNTWEWYQKARPHIAYVHIKDHTGPSDTGSGSHVWPTKGIGCIQETLTDLARSGYSGFVSIEPHLRTIIHEGKEIDNPESAFETYIRYGKEVSTLIQQFT